MPILYIMCGIPGSGKSTLIENIPLSMMVSSKLNIIESDKARELVLNKYGFKNIKHQNTISDELLSPDKKQKIENTVWEGINRTVKNILKNNQDAVIDATNTEQKVLNDWFELGKKYDFKVKVIVMTTPLNICIERNNNREQPVPEDVMNYMYNAYISTIGWLYMNHNEKIINSMHL